MGVRIQMRDGRMLLMMLVMDAH